MHQRPHSTTPTSDILDDILARIIARMLVSVSMSVSWNAGLMQHAAFATA